MAFKTSNYLSYVLIALCAAAWMLLTFWLGLIVVIGYYSAILALLIFVLALFAVRGRVVLEEDGIAVTYGIRMRRFAYGDIRYMREAHFAPMSANMSFAVPNIAIRLKEGGIWGNMHFTVAIKEKDAFLEELHNRRPEIEIQRKKK
jgi:hypothetical protein